MSDYYTCSACSSVNSFTRYVRTLWTTPQPVRCDRCGAVHSVVLGEVSRITPDMWPMNHSGVRSPWMLPRHRPLVPGPYDVRFRTTEPHVLSLQWDGVCFRHQGERVQLRDLLTWRGMWQ